MTSTYTHRTLTVEFEPGYNPRVMEWGAANANWKYEPGLGLVVKEGGRERLFPWHTILYVEETPPMLTDEAAVMQDYDPS